MKRQIHTPTGIREKEYTEQEIDYLASKGDPQAKKEQKKKAIKTATTEEKVEIILEYLELK